MKILFIIDSLSRGGKERRMVELLKGLGDIRDCHLLLAVLSHNIQYQEIFDLGIPVHVIDRKYKYDFSTVQKISNLCKHSIPDIIHCWGTVSSLFAIPVAKSQGIKLINGNISNAIRSRLPWNKRYFLTRLTYSFADAVIGNSIAGLKSYKVPTNKAHLINNGFDFQRVTHLEDPSKYRSSLGIRSGPVVGMIGTFDGRKDFKTFVQSAVKILDQGREVTFLAIGEGPQLEMIKDLVPLEYKNNILFPGMIKEIEEVISIFDIGVLCTDTDVHEEGISNVIMEYMALAKPVVATASGGTSEIVIENETGYLTSGHSLKNLIDKISFLLDHPKEAEAIGKNGQKRIRENFSIKAMVAAYYWVYQKLLQDSLKVDTRPEMIR